MSDEQLEQINRTLAWVVLLLVVIVVLLVLIVVGVVAIKVKPGSNMLDL